MFAWLRRWHNASPRTTPRNTANRTRLGLESLEARDVPATLDPHIVIPSFNGTTDATIQLPTAVTGADFDHDGHAELVVGAGAPGVGGRVAIFEANGSVYNPGFFAFPGFGGSVSLAAGDVTGDGTPDVVVGAGPGSPGGEVA